MNHWRLVTISSGRSPFSKNFTGCVIGRGSPMSSPDAVSSSTIFVRALVIESDASWCTPLGLGCAPRGTPAGASKVTGRSVPFGCAMARTGSDSSRHHTTSVRSPKVPIIAMPLPFSGSASGCAFTGTGTPKRGVQTDVPKTP